MRIETSQHWRPHTFQTFFAGGYTFLKKELLSRSATMCCTSIIKSIKLSAAEKGTSYIANAQKHIRIEESARQDLT
jgi:hypothetical protein